MPLARPTMDARVCVRRPSDCVNRETDVFLCADRESIGNGGDSRSRTADSELNVN